MRVVSPSWKLCGCSLVLLAGLSTAAAVERPSQRASPDSAETVEMFAAIEAGQLAVQLIPRDSTEARVVLTNKTERPLRVQLPEAFAASPVLAQIGGGIGGGGQSAGINAGGGGAQTVGGGMGGPGGVGAGGGFFNVPAEKTGRLNVPLVCLEHGKKEPRAAIPYQIKPLEQFSSDPVLRELLVAFGKRGSAEQRATQAAAWHLASKMSWSDLTNKQIERLAGPNQPYFTSTQIRSATELVGNARRSVAEQTTATQHDEPISPGEEASPQR